MGTKEDIFNTIGDLLQDLNAQYLSLSDKGVLSEVGELITLEAKAQSVAAYITLLKANAVLHGEETQHVLTPSAMESKKMTFNDYFTPPSSMHTSAQTRPQPPIADKDMENPEVAISAQNEPEQAATKRTVEEGAPKQVNEYPSEHNQSESKANEPVADAADPVSARVKPVDEVNDEPHEHVTAQPISREPAREEQPQQEVRNQAAPNQADVAQESKRQDAAEEEATVVTEIIEEQKEIIIQEEINTVVDETPSRPLTLNEIISQQKQAGVKNRVYQVNPSGKSDKLVDIKTGISLNDKLLFIKDLFNGYSLAYSEAVELLNRFSSYAEADAFLQTNYAVKNRWADKPHTVEKLYEVLRRRYS